LKVVALPSVTFAALTKEMLPVQEAGVPLDGLDATLTALTWAVSVLASPVGGKVKVCVEVVVVCA
jgi:hypothetical protein